MVVKLYSNGTGLPEEGRYIYLSQTYFVILIPSDLNPSVFNSSTWLNLMEQVTQCVCESCSKALWMIIVFEGGVCKIKFAL